MAAINSLGAGSGLLTSDLLDKIIASERSATDLRLNSKRAEANAKLSAIGSVRTALTALSDAATALNSASAFTTTTASSSNSAIVTASSSTIAVSGTHSVEVTALATAHTLRSERFTAITSPVGTGTLTFRFGTTTYSGSGDYQSFAANADAPGGAITIDSSNNSLGGVRDAINNANLGIKARIVDDGGGFRLVLTASGSGIAHSVEVVAAEGSVPGLAKLAFNAAAHAAGTNLSQSVAGGDAAAVIDGISITRPTNVVGGVIDGVTLSLTGKSTDGPTSVLIASDTSKAVAKVQAFVDAFNKAKALSDQLTSYDVKTKVGGLLLGDATLSNVNARLRRALNSVVNELPATSVHSLVGVGITSDSSNGYKLSLDSNKFIGALSADPQGVTGLFSLATSATDSLVQVIAAGTGSRGGRYDVNVARLASTPVIDGASVPGLAGATTIDATNDTLKVEVDGFVSGTVTLAHGSYSDGAALASELQQKINADSKLRTTASTVSVSFDAATNHLHVAGGRFGASARLGIVEVGTATAAILGLSVVDAATNHGLDVVGTINGVAARGAGQILTVPGGVLGATAARLVGGRVALAPVTIDATNKTLKVRVDGTPSGSIELTEKTYATGTELATELEAKINSDAALTDAHHGVTVQYDPRGRFFSIVSKTTGVASSIAVTEIGAAASATLGIAAGAGIPGHVGTTAPDAAANTQVKIQGGGLGDRGQVTIVRGVVAGITELFTDVLGTGGAFSTRAGTLNAQLAAIDKEAESFTKRISSLQTRLQTQFTAADSLIAKLNSTSSFLTQQLNPPSKNN